MMSEQKIALEMIRRDGGTQSRSYLSSSTIEDYAAAMKRGEEFPAVKLIYTGDAYYLVDGFHRVAAAEKAGLATINAEVEQGTLEDAQWASYAANPTHGLPRSSDDKRRAITAALKHPKGVEKSDREIATHIRVDHKTVGSVRKQLIERGEIPHLEERVGADGKTYKVPVVQESMDGWKEKWLQPWVDSFGEAELVLVQYQEGLYLCLSDKWSQLLVDSYALRVDYTSIRNASGYVRTVKLGQSYAEALLSVGHSIHVVELSDLTPFLKKFADAAAASRHAWQSFSPLSFDVQAGDLVMSEGSVVYRVADVRPIVLLIEINGGEGKQIFQFSEVKPYKLTWSMDQENELSWQHTQSVSGGTWHKRYAALKAYYAANAVLIYKTANMVIALGEDAERFKTTGLGLYAQTKLGPAYVIMLGKKKIDLNFGMPVVSFSSYHDGDAVSWASGLIGDTLRNTSQAAPEPAHSPTGESLRASARRALPAVRTPRTAWRLDWQHPHQHQRYRTRSAVRRAHCPPAAPRAFGRRHAVVSDHARRLFRHRTRAAARRSGTERRIPAGRRQC
ncbi:MAG: ParB N-terminal domain-containing protein [Chloroflexi bacterium]|uniref:ParB N-terminal domain-containing protein n=1 Tax=Candidatus Flexifilum breve TaxID=3140694 RepID=UPI00313540A3|nr:ParB N-terminal domain-containing protein [Chloroflexota bacterium]